MSADDPAAVAETHISWIFFSGERAYKLLKPVDVGFLDHTEPEVRIADAEREVELNRRFAPDVYLGLADVHEGDVLADRMIVMRRLPSDRRLSGLVGTADFDECLRSVVRIVATVHADSPPIRDAPMAGIEALREKWDENFAALGPHVGSVIEADDHERAEALVSTYLEGRRPLFDGRIAEGFVRDGHGDLIADDIFCLPDGPRIVDCLAFRDDWRIGDVLNDIAFLAMDAHRLAGADRGLQVLAWYHEFSNWAHPASLAHHYVAFRAHVRAKVACLRHEQGDADSADLARTYHDLALHHLEAGRVRLVLVGGGAGVGKSTVAAGLGDHFAAPVLVADEIRKDLTETPKDTHRYAPPGEGIYDVETSDATYGEMLHEAALLLERAETVVLDASWTSEHRRAAARDTARLSGAELIEIECVLDPQIAKQRIAERAGEAWNPSDATPEIVDHLATLRDPWPSAMELSTAPAPEAVVREAVARITERPPRLD